MSGCLGVHGESKPLVLAKNSHNLDELSGPEAGDSEFALGQESFSGSHLRHQAPW